MYRTLQRPPCHGAPSRTHADTELGALLDQLAGVRFCDIEIRPFRVLHDGVTFGLIDEFEPERGDWAELYPDRIGLSTPWDGTYST